MPGPAGYRQGAGSSSCVGARLERGHIASIPKPSRTGQHTHQYSIQELLGSGGTGEVYAARDTRLDRAVAIKFLFQERLKSEPVIQRFFFDEAKATSALNHPNIVTIHDFVREEGVGAIVMENVDGTTLRKAFPDPISEAEVVRIGVQIARALDAAHTQGIVHRDIKPENVMIRKDGYAKLVDFGLAILMGRKYLQVLRHSRPAPCAICRPNSCGDPVGISSDIYSGLVLFELLFGPELRPLDTEAVLRTVVEHKLPAVHLGTNFQEKQGIDCIAEGYASTPLRRAPSAGEVVRRLESIASRTPIRLWPFAVAARGHGHVRFS